MSSGIQPSAWEEWRESKLDREAAQRNKECLLDGHRCSKDRDGQILGSTECHDENQPIIG